MKLLIHVPTGDYDVNDFDSSIPYNILELDSEYPIELITTGSKGLEEEILTVTPAYHQEPSKVYIPWQGFNRLVGEKSTDSIQYICPVVTEEISNILKPALLGSLDPTTDRTKLALLGRLVPALLGNDLKSPVDLVVLPSPKEDDKSVSNHSVSVLERLAVNHGIKVIHLTKSLRNFN